MKHILASNYTDFIERFTSKTLQYFKQGATERDHNSVYPEDLHSALKHSNISEIWDSEGEISLIKFGLVLEGIARYDCSSAALILTNYVCPAILLNSVKTSKETEEVAQSARLLNKSIALAHFENSAGLNFKSLATVCRAESNGFSLRGSKRNVLGAKNSDYIIVSSLEEDSDQLYFHLIESGLEGITMRSYDSVLGLRSAGFSDISLEDIKVQDSQVIGTASETFELMHKVQKIVCIGTAFIALGLSKAAYEKSFNRSLQREQFRRAIIDFQAIQIKLSKMYAKISSLEAYLYSMGEIVFKDISLKDIFSAKILATDYATDISNETVQIFGGYGYIKNDGIDRYMRDSKVLQVFPESNEVLHMQVANELKSIHSKK